MSEYDSESDLEPPYLLAAGLNTYQDLPGMKRTIASIIEHVDKIFVVDGRYPDWGAADDPQFSTDGTQEFCESHPLASKKIEYHQLFAEQKAKRSRYLELAKAYRFLLVIDSDDYILSDSNWSKFLETLRTSDRFKDGVRKRCQYVHNMTYVVEPGKTNTFGKLIYRPGELRYTSHWYLIRKADGKRAWYQNMGDRDVVEGIVMSGNDNMRPNLQQRFEQDIDYQWALELKEGAITAQQYSDPQLKARFRDHNIHEMSVWGRELNKES